MTDRTKRRRNKKRGTRELQPKHEAVESDCGWELIVCGGSEFQIVDRRSVRQPKSVASAAGSRKA
jgi:hypothetical protein